MSPSTAVAMQAHATAASELPDSYFLGQVVAFTIREADVNLEVMRQELTTRELRADLLKKKLRRIDAFKKATTQIATRFTKFSDHQNAVIIRPVGQDDSEAHRHVLFERTVWRVGQQRRVEHETIYRLMYDRGERDADGTVTRDHIEVEKQVVPGLHLTDEERTWLDQVIGDDGDALRERVEHHCAHLDSHGVRTFVRDYLHALDAINVKGSTGGGVYFVPQTHVGELRVLAEYVRSIGSTMHLIPVLDIVELRDMLEEAFVADTLEDLRAASAEIHKILAEPDRGITGETYQGYADRAAAILAKSSEYESLLERTLESTTLELNVFKLKTLQLQGRIRRPKSLGKR